MDVDYVLILFFFPETYCCAYYNVGYIVPGWGVFRRHCCACARIRFNNCWLFFELDFSPWYFGYITRRKSSFDWHNICCVRQSSILTMLFMGGRGGSPFPWHIMNWFAYTLSFVWFVLLCLWRPQLFPRDNLRISFFEHSNFLWIAIVSADMGHFSLRVWQRGWSLFHTWFGICQWLWR